MSIRTIFVYSVGQWLFCLFLLLFSVNGNAQESTVVDTDRGWVLLKTNLLHDVTSTLNLGAEFLLSDRFSLDLPLSYNPWKLGSDRYWKHLLFQPELRYWPAEQPEGPFFGLHAHYGTYDVSRLPDFLFSDYMSAHRFEGWLAGAGVSYGYRWQLNPRWGLEATLGLGYAYLDYDKYEAGESEMAATGTYHYFGPTRAGVTLSYRLGSSNRNTKRFTPNPFGGGTFYDPSQTTANTERESLPKQTTQTEWQDFPAQTTAAEGLTAAVVSTTPTPSAATAATKTPVTGAAGGERVEKGIAYLDYAQGTSGIDYDFGDNAGELRKIHELIESIQENPYARITGISLVGHASPEGFATDNFLLSADRALALRDHLKIVHTLPETLFTADGRGEDWLSIDRLVATSAHIKKYMLLEIIRGTRDADERELRLREEWPDFYEQLRRETYPRLRRIEYEITYVIMELKVEN